MIEKQNKVLTLLKEKFLAIDGFKLIEENQKAMLLEFKGHSINLEAQLDKSNTFTTIFITDIQEVLTSNDLLKEIRFNDEDKDDADVNMASVVINEIPIDIYQVIHDLEQAMVSSKQYYYKPVGFEREDYKTYSIKFECQGRKLSITLEIGDRMYMLTPNLDNIVNNALKDNFKKNTELAQGYVNSLHRP